jgi:hypothetical protein
MHAANTVAPIATPRGILPGELGEPAAEDEVRMSAG